MDSDKFFENYFADHDFMCKGSRNCDAVNFCIWVWIKYGACEYDEFRQNVTDLFKKKTEDKTLSIDESRYDADYFDDKIGTVFNYLPSWGPDGSEEDALNYAFND